MINFINLVHFHYCSADDTTNICFNTMQWPNQSVTLQTKGSKRREEDKRALESRFPWALTNKSSTRNLQGELAVLDHHRRWRNQQLSAVKLSSLVNESDVVCSAVTNRALLLHYLCTVLVQYRLFLHWMWQIRPQTKRTQDWTKSLVKCNMSKKQQQEKQNEQNNSNRQSNVCVSLWSPVGGEVLTPERRYPSWTGCTFTCKVSEGTGQTGDKPKSAFNKY